MSSYLDSGHFPGASPEKQLKLGEDLAAILKYECGDGVLTMFGRSTDSR